MYHDTPTKFVARTTEAGVTPGSAVDREQRCRIGIAEHKRFERYAEVLFERNAIRERNTVNACFLRLLTFLTLAGGFVLFILK